MTTVIPFKAVRFNEQKVNLSSVVSPPYDIISAEKQKHLLELSTYNLVHIDFGKDLPGEDKYARAAGYFQEWLKKNVLIREERPAVYFYSQQYAIRGEKRIRYGFLALLKLDEGHKANVFGHEHTHLEAKEDRLRLIRQVKANTSPIFVIFSDKKKLIRQNLMPYAVSEKPFIDIIDDDKINHKLWRIEDEDILNKVRIKMEQENIVIADGHHRYEVSCAYRDEMKRKLGSTNGTESFNYILAYFTNLDTAGLTVFPIHRIIKFSSRPDMPALIEGLKKNFYIEEFRDKTRFLFLMQKAGTAEHVIGMYNGGSAYWMLRLKNIRALNNLMSEKGPEYRKLDVSMLNYAVFKDVMNMDPSDPSITFSPNTEELIRRTDDDPSHLLFILNPTKVNQIVSVALSGEKMPPKSTYFYPKVLSGLVINKHDD